MKRFVIPVAGVVIAVFFLLTSIVRKESESTSLSELKARFARKEKPSVDHSKFVQLQKKFTRPQEITEACISCHNGRHTEVMKSTHWNWEREEYIEGRGIRYIGKKNVLNNFCIGIAGSQQSCNKCHVGYGWGSKNFDFSDSSNIDCLACHDNSNTYVKKSGGAGMPDPSVNLTYVAQHVGKPTKANCGTCHFFGGGGNNVKHGDLEMSLFDASRDVDVHMASDGMNMECVDCHVTTKHQILGKLYSLSSMNRNRSTCEQCHTETPHASDVLNEHTFKVACQTCHIPEYAKVNSTKLLWDWSTAGTLHNGEPFEVKDSLGDDTYLSIKGNFHWGRHVIPDYVWFDGTANHYLLGDTVSAASPIQINSLNGRYNDPDAKIIPVKIQRTKQIYDPVNKTLIQPKLYSAKKGDGGFWGDFNWDKAARAGMKEVNLPYSGHYIFVNTEMYWPVNHMVSPKSEALQCANCHTRENSRLANLKDFYMPGRDYDASIESFGMVAILATLAGVLFHAGFRIASSKKLRKGSRQ